MQVVHVFIKDGISKGQFKIEYFGWRPDIKNA